MKRIAFQKGFTLVELIVVIAIIGILSTFATLGVQGIQRRLHNNQRLDHLIVIANSLEAYKPDHFGQYPPIVFPEDESVNNTQNVLCFDRNALYVHDCESPEVAFIQGFVDNRLLGTRYLPEVPTDPDTASRYVYGRSADGQFYQVAALWDNGDGTYEARTVENLEKGFDLPSIVRAYDGPNFVVQRGEFLPYNPEPVLTATVQNVRGVVMADGQRLSGGNLLASGATIVTSLESSVDIYFSDGSITSLEPESSLKLEAMEVAENDKDNLITRITAKLLSGRLWSKVARLSQQSEFNVETTSAVAGVRGTEFGASADDTFVVRSGAVEVGGVPVAANPAAWMTREANGTVRPSTSAEQDEAINNHYRPVPLHTDMVPRILEVRSVPWGDGTLRTAEITLENLYRTLSLSPAEHTLSANTLRVNYTVNDSFQDDPYPLPDPWNAGLNYTLRFPSEDNYQGVRLRLESLEGETPVAFTAWTSPQLDLLPDSNLSETDIHGEGGLGREGRPFLRSLNVIDTLLVPSDREDTSALLYGMQTELGNYNADFNLPANQPSYVITSSPAGVCAGSGRMTANPQSLPFTGFLPAGEERRECLLTLTLTLPDSSRLTAQRPVRLRRSGRRFDPIFGLSPQADPAAPDAGDENPRLESTSFTVGPAAVTLRFTLSLQGHTFNSLRLLDENGTELAGAAIADGIPAGPGALAFSQDLPLSLFTRNERRPVRIELTYDDTETLWTTQDIFVGLPAVTRFGYRDPAAPAITLTDLNLNPGGSQNLRVFIAETNEGTPVPGAEEVTGECDWNEEALPEGITIDDDGELSADDDTDPVTFELACELGDPDTGLIPGYSVPAGVRFARLEVRVEEALGPGPAITLADICTGANRFWIAAGEQAGCWIRGGDTNDDGTITPADTAESCTAACDRLLDPLGYDASCARGNWNDDEDLDGSTRLCDICSSLSGIAVNPPALETACTPEGSPANVAAAPYSFSTLSCRFRLEDAQESQTCTAPPSTNSRRRICKCE